MTETRNKSGLLKAILAVVLAAAVFAAMFPVTSSAASTRKCYTISTGNTPVYSNTGLTKQYGTIYDTDELTVITVKSSYSKVKYPVSRGKTKTGYIHTNAILLNTTGSSYTADAKVTTYKRPGGAEYGYISKGDKVVKLGVKGSYTQVKYPVSGGYKYGFIRSSASDSKPDANGKIVLDGVTLAYKYGDYFTDNGKQCGSCHNGHSDRAFSDESYCNCKCTATIDGKTYALNAIQCLGFVRYCQSALYKTNDSINPGAFKKVSGSAVAKGKLTASKVKTLVTAAGVGGHIRTQGAAHSMIISKVTSDGFTVIQCNGSNNKNYKGFYKCRIGYSNYTWSSYVKSTYGKRGLAYIKVKK